MPAELARRRRVDERRRIIGSHLECEPHPEFTQGAPVEAAIHVVHRVAP